MDDCERYGESRMDAGLKAQKSLNTPSRERKSLIDDSSTPMSLLTRSVIPRVSVWLKKQTVLHSLTSTAGAPLMALYGWSSSDPRDSDGIVCGNALFDDGDYRTSWPSFDFPQVYCLSSCLGVLKGGNAQIPCGVLLLPVVDDRVANVLIHDSVWLSRQDAPSLSEPSVFGRTYDLVVPLPSSKGPTASSSNTLAAKVAARAFSPILGGNGGPNVETAILRVQPMAVKSTETKAFLRRDKDAPRKLHFSNMLVERNLQDQVRGARILLWDGVITWGNTSEAARNLLLLAGASRVDVLTAFSSGPLTRIHQYTTVSGDTPVIFGSVGDEPSVDTYKLQNMTIAGKTFIEWEIPEKYEGNYMQFWHDDLGTWVEGEAAHFVPNDVPW